MRAPSASRCTRPGPRTKTPFVSLLANPWKEPLTVEAGVRLFDELKASGLDHRFGAIRAARKAVLQGIAAKLGVSTDGTRKMLAERIEAKLRSKT